MVKRNIYQRILKNKNETLDRELILKQTTIPKDNSLLNELKHYVLLIVVSILYLLISNFFSKKVIHDFSEYNRLLFFIFVLYPFICCAFGAFIAIFKHKNYSYPQRLLRFILKLIALYFIGLAFVFTVL